LKRIYKLLLPLTIATVTSHASATKTIKHTVKKGDSLYAIALKNHTTVDKVRKLNGIKKGEPLKIGKVLKVPTIKTAVKKKKKVAKVTKKKKKVVKKTTKKKTTRVTSVKKKKLEHQLAKNLKKVKFKKISKSKKNKGFALGDIIFGHKGSKVNSSKIIKLAQTKLGRRYVWGATGKRNTFDCSGFTTYVCKKNGIQLPRRAIEQSKYGKYVSRNNLKPGDLIFFDTSKRRKGYVNHVGIYLGNNKFIHASSAKKKVVITSLSKPFYSKRYKGARRVSS